MYGFIDQLPYGSTTHTFSGIAATWDYAIPSGPQFTDYNIAIGGSQIHTEGKFDVTKGLRTQYGVIVDGRVTYSIEDEFNFNRGVDFLGIEYNSDDFNLLEKCGTAAPFHSYATWTESVRGQGGDLANKPPSIGYFWRYTQ